MHAEATITSNKTAGNKNRCGLIFRKNIPKKGGYGQQAFSTRFLRFFAFLTFVGRILDGF